MTVYTDVLEEQRQAARLDPGEVMGGDSYGGDATRTTRSRRGHGTGAESPTEGDGDSEGVAPDAPPDDGSESS